MADMLTLPPGRAARWIMIPLEDLRPKQRRVHIARTTVAGCQTECGITLRSGWHWSDGADQVPVPRPAVCEECWELINALNLVRQVEA